MKIKFQNDEPYVLKDDQLTTFERNYIKDRNTGCWIWMVGRDKDGYGQFWIGGKTARAHRVAYEHYKGIKADGILDHIVCDNPSCVNPDHLIVSTMRDNTLRGTGPSAINAQKTHCKNGHLFDAESKPGQRYRRICTICKDAANKRTIEKRRQKRNEDRERRQSGS